MKVTTKFTNDSYNTAIVKYDSCWQLTYKVIVWISYITAHMQMQLANNKQLCGNMHTGNKWNKKILNVLSYLVRNGIDPDFSIVACQSGNMFLLMPMVTFKPMVGRTKDYFYIPKEFTYRAGLYKKLINLCSWTKGWACNSYCMAKNYYWQ